jgi:ABC-2 type transport system permease protein
MHIHHRRAPLSMASQILDLLLIELTNWRWSWQAMIVIDTIAPLLSMLALSVFARDSGERALMYVFTGNIVIGLMFGNMGKVESHVTFMRSNGSLDYFASLPIRRSALVIAIGAAFLVLSLPSLAATTIGGALLLGMPLHPSPLFLLVVPLCALPLAGLGALIGASVPRPEMGSAINLLVTLLLSGLGPVVVPPERLPEWLTLIGRLSPATYAASALRQTLLGPVTAQIWWDLCALAGIAALTLWLAGRRLDWRER